MSINKLKVGSSIPKAILFDKMSRILRIDFNTWEINKDVDVVISKKGDLITIKKFKANQWIIRSKEANTSNTHISDLISDLKLNIKGINNSEELTWYTHGTWGGPEYRGKGLSMLPCNANGAPYTTLWPWDLGIPSGKLKNPNSGSNSYGYWIDGDVNIFNIKSFPNNSYTVWLAALFMFTGKYPTDTVVDISSNPIVLKQLSNYINPSNAECWKAYISSELVYEKTKTLENCWKLHKYAWEETKDGSTILHIDKKYITENSLIYMPEVVDWKEYFDIPNNKFITWGIPLYNVDFWEKVREWYATHNITSTVLSSNIFKGSNFTGSLTLNMELKNSKGEPFLFMTGIDAFYYVSVEEVHYNMIGGCSFSVGLNMFRGATNLKKVSINGAAIGGVDCSGMFEFCRNLTSYPNNFINWGWRSNGSKASVLYTNIGYTFEGSALKEIPLYNTENRFDDSNLIIPLYAAQAFNDAGSLTKVGPVLNLILLIPGENTYRMFRNCKNITDIRIKNLSHGSWNFNEPENIYLPALDRDSIVYLFDNLMNLKYHNSETVGTNPERSFETWKHSELGNGSVRYANVLFFKGYSQDVAAESVVETNAQLTNMKIEIFGLNPVNHDTIVFSKTGQVGLGDIYFTENGEYTINKTNLDTMGFKLYSDLEDHTEGDISVVILSAADSRNPRVDHANLTCPPEWKAFVTQDMISKANTKGWNVII